MELTLIRQQDGALAPYGQDSIDKAKKIRIGRIVVATLRQPRNPDFHRRFFALLQVGFDAWTETAEPLEYKGQPVTPTMERFRKDITILSGYFEPVYSIKGELRLEAKSISFSSMSQEEFEALYSQVINTILSRVLTARGYTEQSLREYVERVLGFDR